MKCDRSVWSARSISLERTRGPRDRVGRRPTSSCFSKPSWRVEGEIPLHPALHISCVAFAALGLPSRLLSVSSPGASRSTQLGPTELNRRKQSTMFSNLANYLLGSHTQEVDLSSEAVAAEVRLRAVEADDDWVLVEKAGNRLDGDFEESVGSLSTLEVAISTIPHSLRPSSDMKDYHSLTRTSSTSSLPCLSFEESWFLTPPPCFTSAGPVHMETSPLENLLIEHPSMSVYQHSSSHFSLPPQPRRSGSLPPSSPSSASSVEGDTVSLRRPLPAPTDREENVIQPNTRRQAVYSLQQQQERQSLQIRSAQKIQQRRAYQALKRNHLDRHNKAREINSRNKLQRRSDHMQHHSGANNNRKC